MFSLFASCYWTAFSHCERRIPCKQNMKWAYGIMGHSIGSIMGAMLDLVAMSSTEMSSKLVDGFPIKPIWNHLNLNLPFFLDFPSFIRFRASLNRFLSPSFFTHPPFQGTPGSLAVTSGSPKTPWVIMFNCYWSSSGVFPPISKGIRSQNNKKMVVFAIIWLKK